jgi:hypothetical protein
MGGARSTNGGGRGMLIGYWWESQKERDHWKDKDVSGRTILRRKINLRERERME